MPKLSNKRTWKKCNDEKLFGLFRLGSYKGGVEASNCDAKYIREAVQEYFSWCKMRNFSLLYHKKARNFELNKVLMNARKYKKENKTPNKVTTNKSSRKGR